MNKRTRRRLIVLGSLIAVCIAGVFVVQGIRSMQAARLAEENRAMGMSAYERGDYEKALEYLNYYVTAVRDDVEALIAFGDTRSNLPESDGSHLTHAIALYSEALRLDPGNIRALEGLLPLYQAQGRRVELIDAADQLIAIDPDNVTALSARAIGRYLSREYEAAATDVQTLIKLEPDHLKWRYLQAEIAIARGSSRSDVLAPVEEWIEAYEGDGRAYLLKAMTLVELGEAQLARETAAEAVEQGAGDPEVLRPMLDVLDLLEMAEKSREMLNRAKERFAGEPWIWEQSIRQLWRTRRYPEAAREVADAGEAVEGAAPDLLKWHAMVLIEQQNLDEARDVLAQMDATIAEAGDDLDLNDRAWAEAVRGEILREEGRIGEAIRALRSANVIDPRDPVFPFLLGRALEEGDETEKSVVALGQAHQLDRYWLYAGVEYAGALLRAERVQEALDVSRRMLERAPPDVPAPWVMFTKCWVAAAQAWGDTAVVAAQSGVSLRDILDTLERMREVEILNEMPDLLVQLVEARLLAGDREGAVRALQALLQEDTSEQLLLAGARLSLLYELGVAPELLDRIDREFGRSSQVAELRARLLHASGKTQAGAQLLEEASVVAESEEERIDLAIARCDYAITAGKPDAVARLRDLLSQYGGNARVVNFVLAQRLAWTDRDLIASAVNRLSDLVADASSPRLLLTQARFHLRFPPEDAAARDRTRAEALSNIGTVLRETPESLAALTHMADVLLNSSPPNRQDAIKYLQRAVNLYPAQVSLYPRLIALLQEAGDYNTAREYLSRLSRRSDLSPRMKQVRFEMLLAQGDLTNAIEEVEQAVQRGAATEDRLLLASLYIEAGRHDEAEEILTSMISGGAGGREAVDLLADLYVFTGRAERAVRLIEGFDWSSTDSSRHLVLGAFYSRHRRFEQAIPALERAVDEQPISVRAWSELASAYLATGDLARARSTARKGLDVEPEEPALAATFALASLDLDASSRDEAIELLRRAGTSDQALIETIEMFDEVADRGDRGPASEQLRRVRQLVNKHNAFLPGWRLAVQMHAQAGRQAEAIQLAHESMQRFPAQAAPAEWATRLLLDQRRFDEALDRAVEWRSRSLAQPYEADLIIASLNLRFKNPERALNALEPHEQQLFAGRREQPAQLGMWLRALVGADETRRAATIAQELFNEDENWLHFWLELAQSSDVETASAMLTAVERAMQNSASRQFALAGAWLSIAKRTERETRVTRLDRAEEIVTNITPESGDVRITRGLMLGSIAEARSDLESAVVRYRAVLDMQADHPIAMNNLAYALTRLGRGDEALTYSSEVVRSRSDVPDFLDTHAQALRVAGRYDEAERFARQAIAARQSDPAINLTLAEVLYAQSRQADAARVLDEVRRLVREQGVVDPELSRRIQILDEKAADVVSEVGAGAT